MAEGNVPIRFSDESQQTEAVQAMAAEVSKILTPNEELLYIAMQNATALALRKDAAVATSNRIIFYDAQLLGRANFIDFHWQDVAEVKMQQGMLSSGLQVEVIDGRQAGVGNLDKDQARRLYGICHQMEQEWREKRRIREMEEARARAGGIYVPPPSAPSPTATAAEDPVEKLARAKAMLDQGLISETEYDTLKAKILSSM